MAAVERASQALPQKLVFVDLETTGGNAAYNRITEVGIVRVEYGRVTDQWSCLVNPDCLIPSYIEDFTGISNEMVAGAPRFADIAAMVAEKLHGAVFAAHNARFDYSFLRSEFRRAGMPFSYKAICTVKLSRRLNPEFARHNLDAVMERHGLTCAARHRALGDAQVLRDFWLKLCREVPEPVLNAATEHALLVDPQLPAHLPPELADELPEGSGAYRYFGENDVLLYVGKSNSLRGRVLSQLSSAAGSRDGRLSALVRRVDWVATAGELGAMLLEADWIRRDNPRFNRRLRNGADRATLRQAHASGHIEVRRIDLLDPPELTQCFGIFQSAKTAYKALLEIARERQLCLKVLGVEESAGSCCAFQLGKCRGACTGKEPLLLHSVRVQLALSSLKIKSWPFPGRIGLRERTRRQGSSDEAYTDELHVLDHWSYLGTARSEEELAALSARQVSGPFDVDVYKILIRYFSSHPKIDWRELHDVRDKTGCI